MLQNYRMIWGLLNPRERRQFVLLGILTVVMAMFEVVGVAAILPFLSMLDDPSLIETNRAISLFAQITGLSEPYDISIAFGLTVLVLLILGMAVRALGTYAQVRFATMRGCTIATRLLRTYLRQPYAWFLTQNTSEFGQSLLSEIDVVIRQSVLPAVIILSNCVVTLCIAAVVFIAEPVVALSATVSLASVYLIVFALLKKPLYRIGQARVRHNKARFQTVQEVSGGIKEVKVMGLEQVALDRFRPSAYGMARTQAFANITSKLPRFALEAVIYGGFITAVLLILVVSERDIAELVPIFGLLGVASMKLFPALQMIYAQVSVMRFSTPALARLHETVTTLDAPPPLPEGAPVRLRSKLELVGLEYTYEGADRGTLQGLSTTIPAHSTLGIVGGTGAGKTTLVDIILGLLTPSAGELRVDGVAVTPETRRGWQRTLGYVPQTIFLLDATVAANIAFGVPEDEIDMDAVERAARTAHLENFIRTELPDGYMTKVGERGVRLSGGQRQRIGIARALYFDPDVLILDEATSALDNLTEKAVMEAVHNLSGKKTILMIAHRLTTVQDCDKILMLEKGRVAAEGTYDELLENHQEFRRLASA